MMDSYRLLTQTFAQLNEISGHNTPQDTITQQLMIHTAKAMPMDVKQTELNWFTSRVTDKLKKIKSWFGKKSTPDNTEDGDDSSGGGRGLRHLPPLPYQIKEHLSALEAIHTHIRDKAQTTLTSITLKEETARTQGSNKQAASQTQKTTIKTANSTTKDTATIRVAAETTHAQHEKIITTYIQGNETISDRAVYRQKQSATSQQTTRAAAQLFKNTTTKAAQTAKQNNQVVATRMEGQKQQVIRQSRNVVS